VHVEVHGEVHVEVHGEVHVEVHDAQCANRLIAGGFRDAS
jgi:hypothetical protein